jgi:hypothetical protein
MPDFILSNTLVTVLIFAFLAAFIVDTISNFVEFDTTFGNALASAVVFLVLAGGLTFYLGGDYMQTAIFAGLLFVADYSSNNMVTSGRFLNALVTGILFAILILVYLMFFAA